MAEEFVSVIKIEAGESEQTVKGLKKRISDLRDEILNLEQGTQEYNDAVSELQSSQRKLDEVMSLTKKTATALDGSYDALVHKMALLKKEWRATNDEARRNELGQQIAEINAQLKEFDASTGNFQRNVGNYKSALDGMEDATEDVVAAMAHAETQAEDFGVAMRNMQETIEPTKAKFESVQKIASGVASGFAAVQGAAALLGVENENLEQTFIKLQAAMALAQGIGGLGDLVEGVGKAKVAFAGLGDKVKALSKVMGKGGWIGIIIAAVAAITALVVWIKKQRQETEGMAADMKKLNEITIENVSKIGEEIGELKLYEKIATDVAQSDELREKAARKVLEALGEEITETSIAAAKNGDYKKKIDQVTAALIMKAKAEAAYGLVVQKYNEAFAEQQRLEQEAAEYAEKAKKKASERPSAGNWLSAGLLNAAYAEGAGGLEGGQTGQSRKQDWVEEYTQRSEQAAASAKKVLTDMDTWVEEFYGGLKDSIDFSKLFDDEAPEVIEEKVMTVAEALELAQKEIMATLEEDIAAMDDIELDIPEIELEDVEGKSKKKADILIEYAEKAAQREIALNAMSELSEEEKAQKEHEINLKLQEDKLALLKRFYEEAANNGDMDSWLDLQQDIADQEIEIEKAKYAEMERLDKQALEEKKKRHQDGINITTQSLQSAADITNALADVMEQKANENGEVSEAEAKKIKGLRIATATMDMLQGIVSAIGSAAGMGPVGWALGAIQAASIATVGGINIAKIKNTDFTGNSSVSPSVNPAQGSYASELPATFTRQITGASEVEALNQDTRVYILESDIQASNTRVQVRESESSF